MKTVVGFSWIFLIYHVSHLVSHAINKICFPCKINLKWHNISFNIHYDIVTKSKITGKFYKLFRMKISNT